MSENSLKRTQVCFLKKNWPEKQLNYTLALFKTWIYIIHPCLKRAVIGQRLLKYDTLAHVAALKLYHNRSIEFGDRGQLCNYTYTTHSFTTACVTHVDQVIKQLVVFMGIINIESGGLIGDALR